MNTSPVTMSLIQTLVCFQLPGDVSIRLNLDRENTLIAVADPIVETSWDKERKCHIVWLSAYNFSENQLYRFGYCPQDGKEGWVLARLEKFLNRTEWTYVWEAA